MARPPERERETRWIWVIFYSSMVQWLNGVIWVCSCVFILQRRPQPLIPPPPIIINDYVILHRQCGPLSGESVGRQKEWQKFWLKMCTEWDSQALSIFLYYSTSNNVICRSWVISLPTTNDNLSLKRTVTAGWLDSQWVRNSSGKDKSPQDYFHPHWSRWRTLQENAVAMASPSHGEDITGRRVFVQMNHQPGYMWLLTCSY